MKHETYLQKNPTCSDVFSNLKSDRKKRKYATVDRSNNDSHHRNSLTANYTKFHFYVHDWLVSFNFSVSFLFPFFYTNQYR